MFHLVAAEWRDARPRGRAADPGHISWNVTSVEVVRACAKAASERRGQGVVPGVGNGISGFDSEEPTR
jgi:hypothetical protein